VARRPFLLSLIALAFGSVSLLWVALSDGDDPKLPADVLPAPPSAVRDEARAVEVLGSTEEVRETPGRESIADSGDVEDDEKGSEPAARADLLVTLTDGRHPVGPALLALDEPDGPRAPVDADSGQAFFENVSPGVRWLRISELPRGWRLARSTEAVESRDAHRGGAAGNGLVLVELLPGDNVREILLERASSVFGVVLGPAGEPIDGVTVLFSAFDESGVRNGELPTRLAPEYGRYEGTLHAGIWSAQVTQAGEGYSLPSPQVVRLRAGASAEVNFTCERSACAIRGRILDESNRPFGGLQVTATRIDTLTEPESGRTVSIGQESGRDVSSADGAFRFEGLARGRYRIRVDPNHFLAVAPPGVNEVGAPVDPVDVEFGSRPVLVVEIAARRPRPIHVRGTIEVGREDPAAASETPTIFLRTRVGGGSLDTVRSWIDGSRRRFDFYVESAVQDPCLEVTLRGERATYPLALSPDPEPAPLVLRFPQ
jgi:hypothetical protein